MNSAQKVLALFLVLGVVFLSGCVKRNLYIKSDPAGATVYFNEKEVGETPLDYDFMWYALHRVKLEKEGFEPIEEFISIRTPLYLWLPLDLIIHLIPFTFEDNRELSYVLTPMEEE